MNTIFCFTPPPLVPPSGGLEACRPAGRGESDAVLHMAGPAVGSLYGQGGMAPPPSLCVKRLHAAVANYHGGVHSLGSLTENYTAAADEQTADAKVVQSVMNTRSTQYLVGARRGADLGCPETNRMLTIE
eukprot:TRINITY_DN56381_c0_g1_i1.p1 TRINITY_DN56381_c0_g1~~TRINITY_DN56381_c0_g1_i1.p1  ORF type:complete len:130 (+),score=34.88 TRINITY_DN56381_c0_g1_i1:132-521(+)